MQLFDLRMLDVLREFWICEDIGLWCPERHIYYNQWMLPEMRVVRRNAREY